MPDRLAYDELVSLGFGLSGKRMDSGELRARLSFDDSNVSITHLPSFTSACWQEPHYHKGIIETYVVVKGCVLLAYASGQTRDISKHAEGGTFEVSAYTSHNLFLTPDTTLYTIKRGVSIGNPALNGNDWYPVAENFLAWFARAAPRAEAWFQEGE